MVRPNNHTVGNWRFSAKIVQTETAKALTKNLDTAISTANAKMFMYFQRKEDMQLTVRHNSRFINKVGVRS